MPNEVIWTPELIKKFWSYVSNSKLSELSFSRLGGEKLLKLVANELQPGSRILDYGSGDGHLAQQLVEKGFFVNTYDLSTVRDAKGKKIVDHGDWSNIDNYDVVFFVEVIEHILDQQMDETFNNISNALCDNGTLIVTTPNNEDLELGGCYCPSCDSTFHRWQHVHSFTEESLTNLIEHYGFQVKVSHRVDFSGAGELYEENIALHKEIEYLKTNIFIKFFIKLKQLLRTFKKKKTTKKIKPVHSGTENQLVCVAKKLPKSN